MTQAKNSQGDTHGKSTYVLCRSESVLTKKNNEIEYLTCVSTKVIRRPPLECYKFDTVHFHTTEEGWDSLKHMDKELDIGPWPLGWRVGLFVQLS